MISQTTYEKIKKHILEKLRHELSEELSYHGLHHTIDVIEQAERIAEAEKVTAGSDLILLKTACLYHDSGFLVTYKGHEEAGCEMAREDLPAFNFTGKEIDIICGIIMATKIPQTPHTKLEEIICDADLDYLGRSDFFTISKTLFHELREIGWVIDERSWNLTQIAFFKEHTYFTKTNRTLREKEKQKHLEMIKAMV